MKLQKAAGNGRIPSKSSGFISVWSCKTQRESEIVVVVDEDTCRCLLVMRMVGVVGSEDG